MDKALAVLESERRRASVIAGGTDLVPRVRCGAEAPAVLVDIGRVGEMRYVDQESVGEGRFRTRIGALATHASVAAGPAIALPASKAQRCESNAVGIRLLGRACRTVGGPQIRARGTLGGNIANASPAADAATALLALGASVEVASKARGRRIVTLESLLRGPGETSLEPDELIVGVEFEEPGPETTVCYLKEGQRNAMAIAVSSVALILNRAEGRLSVALGSVAPTPVRAREAEALFESEFRDAREREALIDAVARAAIRAARPIDDIRASAGYRTSLVGVLVRRALSIAWT
jgi:CO/xanthine dehydrogenase FAD-binding subunit